MSSDEPNVVQLRARIKKNQNAIVGCFVVTIVGGAAAVERFIAGDSTTGVATGGTAFAGAGKALQFYNNIRYDQTRIQEAMEAEATAEDAHEGESWLEYGARIATEWWRGATEEEQDRAVEMAEEEDDDDTPQPPQVSTVLQV